MITEKQVRHIQYYALLSMENVCFDDKEFYESKGKYLMCCKLLNEKEGKYSLEELDKMK